jgi:hypothetical protein
LFHHYRKGEEKLAQPVISSIKSERKITTFLSFEDEREVETRKMGDEEDI